MKKELIIRILPSLWTQVQEHSERFNVTIPTLLDHYCTFLLDEPSWDVPYEINRRITSYHLKEKFALDFPLVRKSVMVDPELLTDVARLVQAKVQTQYKNSSEVNFPCVVRMSFYMLIRSKGYEIKESKFYSDSYFAKNYSLDSEEGFLAKMDVLYHKYKRTPTAREYAQLGGSVSLSYIKRQFGSYNQSINFYQQNRSNLLLDNQSIPYNKKITT
ncbi:MAG: hypothetical protein ACE3L7_33230 [Candidatus Pristimantibacillus sp.]